MFGNVLQVNFDFFFSYCYDSCVIGDLCIVWGVLLVLIFIMVVGCQLDVQSYDSVWCIGVVLECVGKYSMVMVLLCVGDVIDLSCFNVFDGLCGIVVFVVFKGSG